MDVLKHLGERVIVWSGSDLEMTLPAPIKQSAPTAT